MPRWLPTSQSHRKLLGRWGGTGDFTELWTGVLPTVVVDRFRGDDESSLWAISAFANKPVAADFAAIAFGSAVNDWELLKITLPDTRQGQPATRPSYHLFTPIDPYNPVATPDPVGLFQPGLITNPAFTFGSVTAAGGYVAAATGLPSRLGFELTPTIEVEFSPITGVAASWENPALVSFDPPILVRRDTTLAVQELNGQVSGSPFFFCSILYRERSSRRRS